MKYILLFTMIACISCSENITKNDIKLDDQPINIIEKSDFKNVLFSQHENIALLEISTPPVNEVSIRTLEELNAGLNIVENDQNIDAVVIAGSDHFFSFGAGSDAMKEQKEGVKTQTIIAHELFNRIEGFHIPVIAAIDGVCANGGNELALACDIRIAGESSVFQQIELQLGMIPGFGGMQRLPRIIGHGRAMEMIMTGRPVTAKEALSYGLVTSVVNDGKAVFEAIQLAKQITGKMDRSALTVFKKRMKLSANESYTEALRNDQITFDHIVTTDATKAAVVKFMKKSQKK